MSDLGRKPTPGYGLPIGSPGGSSWPPPKPLWGLLPNLGGLDFEVEPFLLSSTSLGSLPLLQADSHLPASWDLEVWLLLVWPKPWHQPLLSLLPWLLLHLSPLPWLLFEVWAPLLLPVAVLPPPAKVSPTLWVVSTFRPSTSGPWSLPLLSLLSAWLSVVTTRRGLWRFPWM